MNKNLVIGVIVIIVLALAGFWLFGFSSLMAPTVKVVENDNTVPADAMDDLDNPMAQSNPAIPPPHEVVYTNAGYAPSSLTIKVGDTVIFKNQSSGNVWTGSAMHPAHMVYSGTALKDHCPDLENDDFDQCQNAGPNTSWSFTFTKAGTWGYHNHAQATYFGKIIVE